MTTTAIYGTRVTEIADASTDRRGLWLSFADFEAGRIVRPPEPAGMSDGFRTMNTATFEMPAEAAADNKRRRRIYVDALRDWIAKGVKSEHALLPEEVQRRMAGPTRSEALADAHFRVGAYLHRSGRPDAARPHLEEAVRLRPES